MSCGRPTQDVQDEDSPPTAPPPAQLCVRCSAPPAIHNVGAAYCHPCFLSVFTARFNRALSGARTVSTAGFPAYDTPQTGQPRFPGTPQGKILVACSGGHSSRALLELVKSTHFSHLAPPDFNASPVTAPDPEREQRPAKKKGKKHGLPKPPPFAGCEVVYVDESSLPGNGPDRTEEVRALVAEAAPFLPFTALKLEDVFLSSSPTATPLAVTPSTSSLPAVSAPASPLTPTEQLHALLAPLSPTSRAALHSSLLHMLLLSHARARGAQVLLTGETSTRIAVRMLAAMSEGRGFAAGEAVAAEYVSRNSLAFEAAEVLVVRSLALSSQKEVEYYNAANALRSIEGQKGEERTVLLGSALETSAKTRTIGALCEDFILSLDASFPSTVPTVVRTAHKLGLRSSSASAHLCAVCGLPAQPDAAAWRSAITISDLLRAQAALGEEKSSAAGGELKRAEEAPVKEQAEPTGARRAPYPPSAAHLLPTPSASDDTAAPSTAPVVTPAPTAAQPLATADPEADLDLASHVCYSCLLVLQEPATSSSAGGASRTRRGGAATAAAITAPTSEPRPQLVLPPYVGEAVRAAIAARAASAAANEEASDASLSRAGLGEGNGIVGTREVQGSEALRREVEGFLLDDGTEGQGP
ncbi:Ncs2p [Rhodotorula paludigena]|uniref:Ncs2p n=1 Tax=Rhodotorula paludigena TaxID=86838 RepID=UPI003179ECD3